MTCRLQSCVFFVALFAAWFTAYATATLAQSATSKPYIERYLSKTSPGDLVPGAEVYGPVREDIPVAPVLRGGERLAWAFLTSDFVGTTGYSGKPIHVLVAIDDDARLTGARLVDHSEPIVLVGIPESKIRALTEHYAGLDLREEATESAHELDIISGATVTVVVIDDSIFRSGLRVARDLGLGGLAPKSKPAGPQFVLSAEPGSLESWQKLTGDGSVRRLSLDIGQVNSELLT